MIVDIHAHYFPKEYNDLLLRIGGRSLPEAARPMNQFSHEPRLSVTPGGRKLAAGRVRSTGGLDAVERSR